MEGQGRDLESLETHFDSDGVARAACRLLSTGRLRSDSCSDRRAVKTPQVDRHAVGDAFAEDLQDGAKGIAIGPASRAGQVGSIDPGSDR